MYNSLYTPSHHDTKGPVISMRDKDHVEGVSKPLLGKRDQEEEAFEMDLEG